MVDSQSTSLVYNLEFAVIGKERKPGIESKAALCYQEREWVFGVKFH